MKTLYFVRHCSATGQISEAPLTELGHQQAQELASFFKDIQIDHIISSPFIRAQDSISPTAHEKNLSLIIDNRLAERILSTSDLPDWLELLEKTFTDLNLKFIGGESSREATDRAIEVVKEASSNCIFVTHGNLLSLLLKHFDSSIGFSDWKSLSNPDIYQITITNNKSIIKRLWT
ncbi:histidine phosphatase family protein [Paenisporosarcina sp. TG-14]|uniref:histidine phosphatase family protein n=1 Tax=Paenisporosarcina sp. TG-14 TaxID=1231057 RepID=UPI0003163680|nr:histidine phosphatase family protein [Paenisporosarcina sp. TG-14]